MLIMIMLIIIVNQIKPQNIHRSDLYLFNNNQSGMFITQQYYQFSGRQNLKRISYAKYCMRNIENQVIGH